MPVVINGTSGITDVDGTAAAPALTGTDTDTGIFFPAANTMAFSTAGTEDMRIDPSGNVGIGTTSTLGNSLLNVAQGVVARNSGATQPYLQTYNSNAGTDLKTWRIGGNNSGGLAFETVNDAYSSATSRALIDSSGNFQFNSGYGSVATAYGCRAWVNFNGTGTVAIRASGNVSSITDNGAGDYTVNFTVAMTDTNYSCVRTSSVTSSGSPFFGLGTISITTSAIRFQTGYVSSTGGSAVVYDTDYNHVAIFR